MKSFGCVKQVFSGVWVGGLLLLMVAPAYADNTKNVHDLQSRRVIVRYHDGAGVVCASSQCVSAQTTVDTNPLNQAIANDSVHVQSCYGLPNMQLKALMARASQQSGQPAPDLTQCFQLTWPASTAKNLSDRLIKLSRAAGVLSAYHAPLPTPLPDADMPTPDFTPEQWYLDPGSEGGHGFRRFWEETQNKGGGVRVVDIEVNFNANHEDLTTARNAFDWAGAGTPIYTDESFIQHGTGAFGMVLAQHNGIGIDGLAPDAEPIFAPEFSEEYDWGVASTLLRMLQHLNAGDVVLLEAQTGGPRYDPEANGEQSQTGLLPVEWNQAEFDAIRIASDIGVIVVEAAGNGEQDLDDPIYEGRFDRNQRDSGAVIVCAGNPPSGSSGTPRAAIGFTNYGARCDVQAPGLELYSTGYGDAFGGVDCTRDRWYTAQFAGTSGASPLVTGALVLLQSLARSRASLLLPEQGRALLADTGLPAAGERRIGAHFDLVAAAEVLDDYVVSEPPVRPELPGLGQRCEQACEGMLVCHEVQPGESYCLNLCAPFATPSTCGPGLGCELQFSGLGMCVDDSQTGVEGDACLAECAINHFCGQDRICHAFCSLDSGLGCPREDYLCLALGEEFGDAGWCFLDESNPDGAVDGAACAQNSDCQGGFCVTDWEDGYCIDLSCGSNDDCNGPDGRCTTTGDGETYCFAGCVTTSNCRSGYTCQNAVCLVGDVGVCDEDTDCPGDEVCLAGNCAIFQIGTSNGTTSTSNGTTATNNGTTSTSNGTTVSTSNGTTNTSNGATTGGNTTGGTSGGVLTTPHAAEGSDGSGCACSASRTGSPPGSALLWLGLVLVFAVRRR